MIKIDSQIVSADLVKEKDVVKTVKEENFKLANRPTRLSGATYKIVSPLSEFSLYVTINYIEIDNKTYPFEIFINSKSLEHQQWIIALTRLISSVFRQAVSSKSDVSFVIKQLKSVFDPNGGYKKKKVLIPSLVSEIGSVIEEELKLLGVIEKNTIIDYDKNITVENKINTNDHFRQCPSCLEMGLVKMEGCDNCLSCGFSKCS